MKVLLAFSPGGHFTEMKQIEDSFGKDVTYVTAYREDTKNIKNALFIWDFKRNPLKLLVNFFESLFIVIKHKPDVIATTGAGIVVPLCYIGKLFGAKIIFIESFCRISSPSVTGKVLYPISDLFLVQWKDLLGKYGKKAKYGGRVF